MGDHDRLRTYVETSSSGVDEPEVAPSLHVRLLDSNGTAAPVMIISSTLDGAAGVGKVRHMIGINMLEERPIPDQADTFSVSMAQSGFPALPSSASASSVLSSNSSGSPGEIMILMQVVSGTIMSASCSDVTMAEGLDLQLGGLFKNNLRDQEAWDNEIDATMRQIVSGERITPLDLPLGPMLFKRQKKKGLSLRAIK